jgi:hypothetical protein
MPELLLKKFFEKNIYNSKDVVEMGYFVTKQGQGP